MYVVLAHTADGSSWVADETVYGFADEARESADELRAGAKTAGNRESFYVHEINTDDIDA